MNPFQIFLTVALMVLSSLAFSASCGNDCNNQCKCTSQPCKNPCPPPEKRTYNPCPSCCKAKGGVKYCDQSAGRFVCGNGDYSACYCDRHAVMNLQKIEGCCLWKGGVLSVDSPTGLVICNDGSFSETCSIDEVLKRSFQSW